MISNKKVHLPSEAQGKIEVQEWKLWIANSEVRGQRLKWQGQRDPLLQDRTKSALHIIVSSLPET